MTRSNRNNNNEDKENDILAWAEQIMREVEEETKDLTDEQVTNDMLPPNISSDPNVDIFLFGFSDDDDASGSSSKGRGSGR
jgi:hypothetical protein